MRELFENMPPARPDRGGAARGSAGRCAALLQERKQRGCRRSVAALPCGSTASRCALRPAACLRRRQRRLRRRIAAEWQAQREVIDPARMPLTRLANAIIDGVSDRPDAGRGRS